MSKSISLILSLGIVAFAYCYALLSPSHYIMFANDFNSALVITTLYSVAVLFGLKYVQIEKIGISTYSWLALAGVFFIQPLVNHITYPDALVFPIGLLLLCALFSVFVVNIPQQQRSNIIKYSAWLMLGAGILSVGTQFIQLFYPNVFSFIVPTETGRLFGNIAQPNQAAFVAVLAVTAVFYLHYLYQKNIKINLLLALSVIILVAGVSMTISRAGVVLLALAMIGAMFYAWQSYKYRVVLFMSIFILSVIGYNMGSYLMQAFFVEYYQGSGFERMSTGIVGLRQVLLERAYLGFAENPIFGIGYHNFMSYGFDRIEQWRFFEPAHHTHNVIAQLAVELGLVGLVAILGIVIVLFKQVILFFKKSLSTDYLFVCLVLLIFVAYSFSEYPLWYPAFLFPFVFLLGLLDKGVSFNIFNLKKVFLAVTVVLTLVSASYTIFYHTYLKDYEIVMFANVNNQQKIDAYQRFPNMFGFRESKEYMLHMIVDEENTDNMSQLIELGDRLIKKTGSMDITRIQIVLLMKSGRQEEADKLIRRVCVWEYQQTGNCNIALERILVIDSNDEMGYVKRLSHWYREWIQGRDTELAERVRAVHELNNRKQ